ncbi:hypothetical protein ABVB40_12230 [Staphylococcus cohnii]
MGELATIDKITATLPVITILIYVIALFVNNFISIRINKLQIEGNVITKSRVEWIQDVRQALNELVIKNGEFRVINSKYVQNKQEKIQ